MRARLIALPACCAVLLAACGGSGDSPRTTGKGPPVLNEPAPKADQEDAGQGLGFPGFATKNTTRVGGADPIADAAGVALAVYPGAAEDSRPQAVSLVDAADWRAAISAAQLASRPLRAPILFSSGGELPAASRDALAQLRPLGAKKAGDAAVLRIGDAAAHPAAGVKAETAPGTDPAAIARAVDALQAQVTGRRTREVIVAPGEDAAFAMPAAGLAAKTGAPVLWTDRDRLPSATESAIRARKSPRIYVIGPASAVSDAVLRRLRKLGTVKRLEGRDPVLNAIAVARFADGTFGWNVVDPGHGLVFASQERTGDAAAAAPLSSSGSHGPLLLVSEAGTLPAALQSYLLDIQPGYDHDPVRGVYSHGWLLGDEHAISGPVQARIDSLLEIQPVNGSR
jgi:hypothetical protein